MIIMLTHTHLFYAILSIGAILVVLYATGNLSNTSNVVVLLLFALTMLAMVMAFESPTSITIPKGAVTEAVVEG